MARTPLLRSLKQLAAEHRLAARKGLPVNALREQRAPSREQRLVRMSRPGFLAGSAAALASLTACRAAPKHDARTRPG